jgi:hypothetical protein
VGVQPETEGREQEGEGGGLKRGKPWMAALDGQKEEQTIGCLPLWDKVPSPEFASGNREDWISRLGQEVGAHTINQKGCSLGDKHTECIWLVDLV